MNEEEFKNRTKKLALQVITVVKTLPKSPVTEVIGRQLLRSSTSVGANYRSACRGKSAADLIAKLAIVEEEADETLYWMELLVEAGLTSPAQLHQLMDETNQIIAMTVASIKTLKSRA